MQVVLMLKSDLRTDAQKEKKKKTQANQSVFFFLLFDAQKVQILSPS